MPFYVLVLEIMNPNTKLYQEKQYLTEDAKLASIRLTRNDLFRNYLNAGKRSKEEGFSEDMVV